MEFTGERYVPAVGGEIRHEHLHRYAFASEFVRGKQVLDIACGEGYGSEMLARAAARVIGVDISPEAIAHATRSYGSCNGLQFLQGSAAALPLDDASIDVIVSFETIEHHAQHEEMMAEFSRVLRPTGLLILSSPNKAVYSDQTEQVNEFHVKELYFNELDALTRRHFQRVTYFGQRLATGSALYPLKPRPPRAADGRLRVWTDDGTELAARPPQLASPMYFVLLATNAATLPRPTASFLVSESSDLYLEFKRVARWASGVHEELVAAQAGAQTTALEGQAQLDDTQRQLDASRQELANAHEQLDRQEQQWQQRRAELSTSSELLVSESAQLQQALSAQTALAQQRSQELVSVRQQHEAESAQEQLLWQRRLSQVQDQLDEQQRQVGHARLQAQHEQAEQAELTRRHETEREEWTSRTAALASSHEKLRADLVQHDLRLREQEARSTQDLVQCRTDHESQLAQLQADHAAQQDQWRAQVLALTLADEAHRAEARRFEVRWQLQEQQASESLLQAHQAHTAQRETLATELDQQRTQHEARVQALELENQSLRAEMHHLTSQMRQQGHDAAQDLLKAEHLSEQSRLRLESEIHRLTGQLTQQEREAACAIQTAETRLSQALELAEDTKIQLQTEWRQRLDAALEQRLSLERALAELTGELKRQMQSAQHSAEATAAGLRARLLYRKGMSEALGRSILAFSQAAARKSPGLLRGKRAAALAGWQSAERQMLDLACQALGVQAGDWNEANTAAGAELVTHTIMNLHPSAREAQSVEELLALPEQPQFVQAAYLTLLGRPADPEGQRHYIARLAEGLPRVQVLLALHSSPEGRAVAPNLRGLQAALRKARLGRIPVLGRFFRRSNGAGGPLAIANREMRAVDGAEHARGLQSAPGGGDVELALEACVQVLANYVAQADGKLQSRVADIEHVIQLGVREVAERAAQAQGQIVDRLDSIERRVHTGVHAWTQIMEATDAEMKARMARLESSAQSSLQALVERGAGADPKLSGQIAELERSFQAGTRGLAEYVGYVDRRLDAQLGRLSQSESMAAAKAELQAQATLIAQSLGRFQWPPETDLWRLSQELTHSDASAFVRVLFESGLRRPPMAYEQEHFELLLSQGASRLMLTDRMLGAPEFLHHHPPIAPALPGTRPTPTAESPKAPILSPMALGAALPSLPIYAEPRVSVVVPIYGKLDYTLRCLHSIAAHPPRVPFEVIVIDDCSTDDSAVVLARVPGIRLESNTGNLGFIRSCNRGATLARGEYLCFLNNDTEVSSGWLDELFKTFDTFPGTGLVGSKLLFPDGSLQEAGGIIWQDGSAWNFGRGQDPSLPVFNYAREVDYCSGASIMVPATLFQQMGGFDEHYLPAYCEDSDLALKIRQAGWRVLYQPLSQVVHHEGVTSGTDTAQGVKSYQVANTQKLFARWQQRLRLHQPGGVDVDRAKDRMSTRRVLVLDQCTPTPNQDAGSVTVVNLLTLLREARFQVTFVAEDNFLYMPDYTPPLQRAGIEVLYAPQNASVEQHLEECGGRYELVLIWRPAVVERHLDTVRRLCPRAKVIYHTVDLHYLRMEREAGLTQEPEKLQAAAEMKARELKGIQGVDTAIVHSTHELEVLRAEIPVDNVAVFPLIMNVPGSAVRFEQRADVAFVGGYQHPPNVDAVVFFVSEVMPLLRQRLPGVRFHIIGSKPPPSVLELAAEDVLVTGFVDELQPVLDRMRLSVAPLRYGAGIKGKVGNSMAMGLPVVATTVAVEGMGITDREHVLIGDGPQGLVDAICELYTDPALWNHLQARAVERVESEWGGGASYRTLQTLLGSLGIEVQAPLHALRMYRDLKP